MKLQRRYVEKPWGRTELPPMFAPPAGKRIGEVWFEGAADRPLLVKYLFTGERLSIQVHPDDQRARERGVEHGKNECWYILDAAPGAKLGLGLRREVSQSALRGAALDGSIEQLIDWREVNAGDFFHVPAGTIHAIGGGIALIEIQQNSDVTFRLYDYGRPRELHLDDAIAVACPRPYVGSLAQQVAQNDFRTLVDRAPFAVVHSSEDAMTECERWVVPLEGTVRLGNIEAGAGDCLLLQPEERLESEQARLLIAAIP